jgi:hypothetical protein
MKRSLHPTNETQTVFCLPDKLVLVVCQQNFDGLVVALKCGNEAYSAKAQLRTKISISQIKIDSLLE